MAFEISDSDLLGATKNVSDWTYDMTGQNPFTNSVTLGVNVDSVGDTVFASQGSLTAGPACEFNGGGCELTDIDLLTSVIATASTDPLFDPDGVGGVDFGDLTRWLEFAGAENLDTVTLTCRVMQT